MSINSILPLLLYYKNKIKGYGYVVNLCKNCDTPFVAKSFHFDLCSEVCKESVAASRRAFAEDSARRAKKAAEKRAKEESEKKVLEEAEKTKNEPIPQEAQEPQDLPLTQDFTEKPVEKAVTDIVTETITDYAQPTDVSTSESAEVSATKSTLSEYDSDDDELPTYKNTSVSLIYDSAYYYWYNRVRKLRTAKPPSKKKIAKAEALFKEFRKEASQKKKLIKQDKLTDDEFSEWINTKNLEIEKFMEGN